MTNSIKRPGVEVETEFQTASQSVLTPTLMPVIVGPCFQIVDAFDDEGNPQSAALAGTYRDGSGVVAYDFPGLRAQADISDFADETRVFLLLGSAVRELHAERDEDVIASGSTGAYTTSSHTFSDSAARFTQAGVLVDDVVRFTYRGVSIDIPVTAITSDTVLTLATGYVSENLTGLTYSIIRKPAEFVVTNGSNSYVQLGTASDYIEFDVQTYKTDGTTPNPYAGADGDQLTLAFVESAPVMSGTDGAVGDAIFTSSGASFLTTVGARGATPSPNKFVVVGALGTGQALRQVVAAISNTQLIMETGAGNGLSSQNYILGHQTVAAGDGVTNGTTTFVSPSAQFTTSIPNSAGTPSTTTVIEIEGVGVYSVDAVVSDTTLTLSGSPASGTGRVYTVVQQDASGSNGATGALTSFASISRDLTTITSPTSRSVKIGASARAISSVTNADNLVLSSGFAASGVSQAFSVVDTTSPLALSWDASTKTITVQLKRASGLSSSTYAEIEDALTTSSNGSYNETVSDIISATLSASGTTTITSASSVKFDGGSDDHQILLDANLLGSTTPTANVYVSYRALRLDVSDQASSPSLSVFGGITEMEAAIGPISVRNPLALAMFFALTNSPTSEVSCLGVSEVTASKPYGTLEAYTSAFEYLEGKDVWLIVPLTQDPTVNQALDAHVKSMSTAENKGERVAFFNEPLPLYSSALNVASGTTGNTGTVTSDATAEFPTSVDLSAAGVQAGDILVVTSLSGSDKSPVVVNGTIGPLYGVTIASVKSGDDFTAMFDGTVEGTSTSWNNLIDVDWTIYRAGAAITKTSDQMVEVAAVGEGYASRRDFFHWPDRTYADVNGTNMGIEGFYLGAAWAGRACQAAPAQGHTNDIVAGFTAVAHSNGYFSESQLDQIAGGGTWINIQESQNAPIKCRHQLSTDVDSIEKREFSITKSLDYTAKFMRAALRKKIGTFNITQAFLDSLATSVGGLGRALVDSKVLAEFHLSLIEQDPDAPDTVILEADAKPLYPGNYIKLKIKI